MDGDKPFRVQLPQIRSKFHSTDIKKGITVMYHVPINPSKAGMVKLIKHATKKVRGSNPKFAGHFSGRPQPPVARFFITPDLVRPYAVLYQSRF